jgi:predicted RNase H-like nuclease
LPSTSGAHRGPELPYDLVAGVKPCATGWLVASAKLHGTTFAPDEPKVDETFVDVLDERPSFAIVALNAPVGYLGAFAHGGRVCDREARVLLGKRGAAIQNAPIRRQVEQGANGHVEGLNAVSRALLPRYREVAAEMAAYRQRSVYEVHPELSFFQLNDDVPLRWSKRTAAGRAERRALLESKIPGVQRILDAELPRVPSSHLLDVAALLWTARRLFARAGVRVPQDPEWDDEGLRMEIVR